MTPVPFPCPVDVGTAQGYFMGTRTEAKVDAIALQNFTCARCRELLEDVAALLREMRSADPLFFDSQSDHSTGSFAFRVCAPAMAVSALAPRCPRPHGPLHQGEAWVESLPPLGAEYI
jgi:hypothetical protein